MTEDRTVERTGDTVYDQEPGQDGPELRVRLSLDDAIPEVFAPLRLPKKIEVLRHDLNASLIEQGLVRLRGTLNSGHYQVPVTSTQSLAVEVLPNCCFSAWVRLDRPREPSDGATTVTSAGLDFNPPLRLGNVFPTLASLPTLFEDYKLRSIRTGLARSTPARLLSAGMSALAQAQPLESTGRAEDLEDVRDRRSTGLDWLKWAVQEGANELTRILLSRVAIRPVRRGRLPQLELRFGGKVECAGQLPIPFRKIHLPRVILPAPHAALDELLSPQPLASALLHREQLRAKELVKELTGMLGRFEGALYLKGTLPGLVAEIRLADQGLVEAAIPSPGDVEVNARFIGEASADHLAIQATHVELGLDGSLLMATMGIQVWPKHPEHQGSNRSLGERLIDAVLERRWPLEELHVALAATVRPGSILSSMRSLIRYRHPLVRGGARVGLTWSDIRAEGDLTASTGPLPAVRPGRVDLGQLDGSPANRASDTPAEGNGQSLSLTFSGGLHIEEESELESGLTGVAPRGEGRLEGRLGWAGGTDIDLEVTGSSRFDLSGRTRVEAFPELAIEDQDLVTTIEGEVDFRGTLRMRGRRPERIEADFTGTQARITLARAVLALDPQVLSLPENTVVSARMVDGVIGTDGLGRSRIQLDWNLQGRSPLLCSRETCVELLVRDLRQGRITLSISPGGGLDITGKEGGLYDAHFFNALINPGSELKRWAEILDDDEAVEHVLQAIRLFSTDLADLAVHLRRFERKVRTILREEGIHQPRDLIPGRKIARVLSKMICDTTRLEEEIYPLVKQVTDGNGLDVPKVTRLLRENLPEHEYELELDRSVRWLRLLLSPTEPVTPFRQRGLTPLAQDPAYRSLLEGLPSAREIYRIVDGEEPMTPLQSATIARVAHYLTPEQLGYLVGRNREDWRTEDLARLRYVQEIKARVELVSQGYGGLSYTPQAMAIAFFLGDALSVARAERRRTKRQDQGEAWSHPLVAEGLLGPQDIAMLLHAGLTQLFQGRTVQLSRRLLLDRILEQPPSFLLQVLLELGSMNTRILASSLNALVDAEQDHLSQPLDLVAILSERLQLTIPRRADYMAGGRFAKLSYWEELNRAAKEILAEAEPYLAVKEHLQVDRHPIPSSRKPSPAPDRLYEEAQRAIAHADEVASACSIEDGDSPKRQAAVAAYREAFTRCAELLERDARAFHLPWFKSFWGRNHEALVVLSVVRNYQEDIDQVRNWLAIRSGTDRIAGEQELLEKVIDALYFYPEDRRQLRSDPLVRLLIDPDPGVLDFTVVSAMGVITEGAEGKELIDAFRRLEERRGIPVVRAHTATFRSLDYNAEQIERAVREVTTPWGYVGYSQGCANGLRAESRLMGGTPDQQALLLKFKCRNLLFSAANGSAHGTCGDWKFLRALVQGDLFVKYYQAIFSDRAIRLFLRGIRMALDSRPLVLGLAGAHSLSHAGVLALGRDGQYQDTAPTSILRGIVRQETLPEALEFLSNVLARQIESTDHDTQVHIPEAVGHFVWVVNEQCEALARCDMGCLVQATHHWSPLRYETEFVTTERDRTLGIYDYPKDRHVFPWIEVNHRFGIIRRRSESQRASA